MGGMYDRAGQPIHPPYRHPNTQFSHSPAGPNYRMMGHPGYPPQGAGMVSLHHFSTWNVIM